jgi:hypothetical protein
MGMNSPDPRAHPVVVPGGLGGEGTGTEVWHPSLVDWADPGHLIHLAW